MASRRGVCTAWSLYGARFDLARILRPALAALLEATGETASFYVRDSRSRIVRYRHNSPKAVRHHLEEGMRLPLGERDPELGAAAVPLLHGAGRLHGALSVSALITRFDRKSQANALAALARVAAPLALRVPTLAV